MKVWTLKALHQFKLNVAFQCKKKIYIPIKMEDFFNVEISIYSRAGFLIYSSVVFSQRCSKIFYKTNKMQVFA